MQTLGSTKVETDSGVRDFAVGGAFPEKNGLYDPNLEKDSCGVGFVADMKNVSTRQTVVDALELLERLSHRGACGRDANSGDGAGILCSIPDQFFRRVTSDLEGWNLPGPGEYAVGNVFLPVNDESRSDCQRKMENILRNNGLKLIGWRKVETNNSLLGMRPKSTEPCIMQLFVGQPNNISAQAFGKALFLCRKQITHSFGESRPIYICSLSTTIIIYKGYLTPEQLPKYFNDLQQNDFAATLAMVHSRFSTNTFPSWERAQPMRYLAHNGEINTLRGNVNWTCARQGNMSSEYFGDSLSSIFPIIEQGGSDSSTFDNVLEFLSNSGKSILESIMIMIPEAWQNDPNMKQEKKDFYEFFSSLMEPWDGPALVSFTDGHYIGAVLDRNGLRPGRYYETVDGRVICASEVGVIDIPDEQVLRKGRLRPGHMFVVDINAGKILDDDQVKNSVVRKRPYGQWLNSYKMSLDEMVFENERKTDFEYPQLDQVEVMTRLKLFGYTVETLEMLIGPMASTGYEALGSMGNDIPLAVLSKNPRNVFEYFRQLFAQVTNPPIDPIREKIVTSVRSPVGPEGNILEINEFCCNRVFASDPVLTPDQFHAISHIPQTGWAPAIIDVTFPRSFGTSGLLRGLARICQDAEQAIANGKKLIILSDRNADSVNVPIMSALALGAVHHFLVQKHLRSKVGIIVESGDAREIHHFCVLIGFGADLIYPYLAYESIALLKSEGKITGHEPLGSLVKDYQSATRKGITKVMSKMGVSTIQSYRGAQIFEALGIHQDVIDLCFKGCASRIGGASFEEFANDSFRLHEFAFPSRPLNLPTSLSNEGYYHWRQGTGSELHLNDPQAIAHLQDACKSNDIAAFHKYTEITNRIVRSSTIRGQFKIRMNSCPVPLSEVEPAKDIVKRFCTGAMSFGSISREAHSTIATAMNRIGGKSNSGEGGEEADRYKLLENGDSMRSAIKQVASARFGVSIFYLTNCVEIQIKMAQGAKPGEGGELPGHKVQGAIALTRRSTPGVGLISPPPHHDIYSIEDLAQLIFDLKNANPSARISVKLVSEVGVGVVAAGVTKGLADHILISGHDGGTGASRWTSIKYAGLPWELGLAEAHQTLVQNGLRERVVLQADGQMKTGLDVVKAALLGAEEFGFGTTALISLGCIMMRKCHLNTCPVGIATQDPVLREKFKGTPENLINFMFMVAEDVRQLLADMGFRSMNEIIGRADLMEQDTMNSENSKTRGLDLSSILKPVFKKDAPNIPVRSKVPQNHNLENVMDASLIRSLQTSIRDKIPSKLELRIRNTDRCVGGMLSHEITKINGAAGLPENTIHLKFNGSAGQSFGAWLAKGVEFELEGDANDYVGKGLSGGRIIVYPPRKSTFKACDNIICGNVVLYGATEGEAFFSGIAAERFCVRNSGATAVVEGVGDHGCEYMTSGRVVVLGKTGRNFAAGMSGGIAFVLDEFEEFESLCNTEMVELDSLDEEDHVFVKELIEKHYQLTHSPKALDLLQTWESSLHKFVKVFPTEYKKVLLQQKEAEKEKSHNQTPENNLGASQSPVVDIEDVSLGFGNPIRPSNVTSPRKAKGFIEYSRSASEYRSTDSRIEDFDEIYTKHDPVKLKTQAARCMDCGIPFCHQESTGCPLGNKIPEWNSLVHKGEWREALDRLLATNNFPEFTGRVCPAPCEGSCVLGIVDEPVTIKNIEMSIIDHAFENGWITACPPVVRTGKKVGVIGSGPAGLAAADQLNKAGHSVTVYERSDRIGGLLMYGVPNMKLDKVSVVERRIRLLAEEGIQFITNHEVGVDSSPRSLRQQFDAIILATGSTVPRDLPINGRDLRGIHFAMEFLHQNTKSYLDSRHSDDKFINAHGKRVVVIGGGDTGNDCIGTSMRHKCKSVVNFELLPQSPELRADDNPWPQWPKIFRVDYAHEEADKVHGNDPRQYCVMSKEFLGNSQGQVIGISTVRIRWSRNEDGRWVFAELPGTEKVFKCDLVFLAMGFIGPEKKAVEGLDIEFDRFGNIKAEYGKYSTNIDGIFAAGDCRRGQSLVVWGISEGRQVARQTDLYLMGSTSLP